MDNTKFLLKGVFKMFEAVKQSLEGRGFSVTCCNSSAEALMYIDGQIDNKTVGIGGSATVEELGLYDKLALHNTVYWHARIPEGKTTEEIRALASTAHVYISSVNALAQTGEIINIDGACNRVSSICYGHEKVFLVVGKNKLAANYDSALYRARNVAAPKNARRLAKKTPCAAKGDKCYDCKSPDRICRALSVMWSKPTLCDYEVVLINEDLGF